MKGEFGVRSRIPPWREEAPLWMWVLRDLKGGSGAGRNAVDCGRSSSGSLLRRFARSKAVPSLVPRCGTALQILVLPLAAAELHVSPDGNDANPGTAAKPFATLHHAQEVSRVAAGKESVSILIHGGTHELASPLVFEPRDSGTAEHPVTWIGDVHSDEFVVSGGRGLDLDWQPFRDGIFRAKVPADVAPIDQLFIGDERRWLARWPNFKAGTHGVDAGYGKGLSPVAGEPASKVDPPLQDYAAFRFDPKQFSPREWRKPREAVLHVFQSKGWGNMQWRLAGVDREEALLKLGEGGWQIGTLWEDKRANIVSPNSKFYVENVFEELDAPGEWYFDSASRTLFYHPVEGEEMDSVGVVACGVKELIVVKGTAEKPVRHLHFKGLSFSHTSRTILDPYETRLRGDWAIARRAAVRFEGAEDCSVSNCRFIGLGGNGVLLSNYNRRVTVSDSLFTDLGDSAVLAVGSNEAVREYRVHRTFHVPLDQLTDLAPGPKTPDYPGECRIHNNLMHDLGVFGKQVAGVYLSAAQDIHVSHNTICRIPRAGICINEGCWGGHLIEFNDLFLTVLETSDHGPINAWGRDRFWQSPHRVGQDCDMSLSRKYARLDNHKTTVIRNNRLRHEEGFSWGIDLDDGASNYLVENNLCIGCSVKLREGYFREVRNNIFVGGNPPNKHCCFEGSDDVFTNNIYLNTRDAWALNRGPSTSVLPVEIDRNVYFCTAAGEPRFGYRGPLPEGLKPKGRGLAFDEWKSLGADRHSVIADPGFVDLEGGDFGLKPDSPALELGFKEFPLDRFGTGNPVLSVMVESLRPTGDGAAGLASVYLWMDASIRNDGKGIRVLRVPATSSAHRAGFREGDLLTHMNGTLVGSVEGLIGIISGAAYKKTEFRVTRGKQTETVLADGPGGVPSKESP